MEESKIYTNESRIRPIISDIDMIVSNKMANIFNCMCLQVGPMISTCILQE